MEDLELLKYAIEHGMINMTYVRSEMEMNKKKEILKKYGGCIWYSEKEKYWYCHIPDDTRTSGRKKVKRKQKADIENVVYEYYLPLEEHEDKKAMSFSELFFDYLVHKQTQVKPVTIKRMLVDWNKFYVGSDFIEKRFTEISKVDVDDFLNGILIKHHPKDKNFKNMCGIMKQTFEYAVDSDLLEKSPYRISKINKKNITRSRKAPSEKEVFTPEEQMLLTQEMERRIQEDESYLIPWAILLDFEIGARMGEVLALKDTDIANEKIHIQRQLVEDYDTSDLNNVKRAGLQVVDYTKSECGNRWVPLTKKAKEYIKAIVDINQRKLRATDGYLFITTEKAITEHSVKNQLERSCLRVGITPRSPHKIRKTYASRLYKSGVSISDISRLLGHADETTTLRHYIFSIEDTKAVDDKVEKALELADNKSLNNEGTKGDQKIVQIFSYRKRKNPENTGVLKRI